VLVVLVLCAVEQGKVCGSRGRSLSCCVSPLFGSSTGDALSREELDAIGEHGRDVAGGLRGY
jgi:hypothetical protein